MDPPETTTGIADFLRDDARPTTQSSPHFPSGPPRFTRASGTHAAFGHTVRAEALPTLPAVLADWEMGIDNSAKPGVAPDGWSPPTAFPTPRADGRPHFTQPARTHGEDRTGSPWSTVDKWLPKVMDRRWGPDQYILNFGAHYGECCDDVVSEYMQRDSAVGLAVDHDDAMDWAGARVRRYVGAPRPAQVHQLLRNFSVPKAVRLLKVDIDSTDVDLVLAVLAQRTPRFIQVEHQELVPPPVCYCHRFSPGWRRLGYYGAGCSLQGYVNALAPRGYKLASVIFNDALFVHESLVPAVARELRPPGQLPSAADAYQSGWLDLPWPQLFAQDAVAMAALRSAHNMSAQERAERMMRYPPIAEPVRRRFADFVADPMPGVWPCRPRREPTKRPDHASPRATPSRRQGQWFSGGAGSTTAGAGRAGPPGWASTWSSSAKATLSQVWG